VPLPPLTENGELPLGVHSGSLREVLDRFGVGSDQRKALALRLARVHRVGQATGHLARFVIFGSFGTSKSEPVDRHGTSPPELPEAPWNKPPRWP